MGISLLSLGDFIRNFITIPWGFHCDFHCYTRGISLQFSLLYLGAFIGNFIVIPGGFHCNFHSYTCVLSLGISLLYWEISLWFSFLYPGAFIKYKYNIRFSWSLRYCLHLVHLHQICYPLVLPHPHPQMLSHLPQHKLRQFCTYYSMVEWSHVSSLPVANMQHSELPYANKGWTACVHMPQHHFALKAQGLPFGFLAPTTTQTSIQKMQAPGTSPLELSRVLPATDTCVHGSGLTPSSYCG